MLDSERCINVGNTIDTSKHETKGEAVCNPSISRVTVALLSLLEPEYPLHLAFDLSVDKAAYGTT